MIVLDGAMGTELAARGVPTQGPGWSAYALELAPEVVRAIHRDYARAGAAVARTNTFRTQPGTFPDRWPKLVAAAVRLVRDASPKQRVAGSIAPIFDCYRPDLSPSPDEAKPAHVALAGALAREGVDLLICETFPHTGEACIAVEAAVATGVETWVALTAGPDGALMTAEAMERGARDCVRAGAAAVLVCCTGARLTLPYVERLSRVGVPFGAYANAGDPADGLGWGAPGAADRYVELAREWRTAGATILGGCCGTEPKHIEALARAFGRDPAPEMDGHDDRLRPNVR
ncbi:MAG TPA: homocysteine S-methyltransferase family protein [Polyangiaceae bacterium]|nr:homocysteine S-methyltransferase family protein [Polyangiaceae bacterium]